MLWPEGKRVLAPRGVIGSPFIAHILSDQRFFYNYFTAQNRRCFSFECCQLHSFWRFTSLFFFREIYQLWTEYESVERGRTNRQADRQQTGHWVSETHPFQCGWHLDSEALGAISSSINERMSNALDFAEMESPGGNKTHPDRIDYDGHKY